MSTPSRIPLTEYNQILQTKSSPEIIVALLNETEEKYSLELKTLKKKNIYPYWKVCTVCNVIYQTHTREQATRKKSCSKECSSILIKKKRKPRPVALLKGEWNTCPVCGDAFFRNTKHLQRVQIPVCSKQCNGKLRAKALVGNEHKGRANWTEESKTNLSTRMTGETNPSWKGGITYLKKKGHYKHPKYVKCPLLNISMARPDGFIAEHRLVVAQHLERLLLQTEVVHHINGNTLDNRLENLMLFQSNRDHKLYENGKDIKPLWQILPQ
jgi:hypothetical protein